MTTPRKRRLRAYLVKHERPCECPLCATVQRLVVDMIHRMIAAPTEQELESALMECSTLDGVRTMFRRLRSEVPPGIVRQVRRERRRQAEWGKAIARVNRRNRLKKRGL